MPHPSLKVAILTVTVIGDFITTTCTSACQLNYPINQLRVSFDVRKEHQLMFTSNIRMGKKCETVTLMML